MGFTILQHVLVKNCGNFGIKNILEVKESHNLLNLYQLRILI